MASFYFAWRGSGKVLPDPGGLFDQAEAMIHGFEVMAEADAWIDRNYPAEHG